MSSISNNRSLGELSQMAAGASDSDLPPSHVTSHTGTKSLERTRSIGKIQEGGDFTDFVGSCRPCEPDAR